MSTQRAVNPGSQIITKAYGGVSGPLRSPVEGVSERFIPFGYMGLKDPVREPGQAAQLTQRVASGIASRRPSAISSPQFSQTP